MRQQVATRAVIVRKRHRPFEIGPSRRLHFDVLTSSGGPRIASMFKGIPEPGLDPCFLNPQLCRKYAFDSVFRQKDLQGCDWILTDQGGNDAGIIHLYYIHESRGKKICTIGYALAPAFRELGFATEAIRHLLYWLAQQGFSYIKAVTGKDNQASISLLEKNGFEPVLKLKKRKGKWVTWVWKAPK